MRNLTHQLREHLVNQISRRRWLKSRLGWALPPIASLVLRTPSQRLRIFRVFYDTQDLRGPSYFLCQGASRGFETYESAEKTEILSALPKDGVFLDVGANIGLISLFVHQERPDTTIRAFEPHPHLSNCLRQTISHNRLQGISVVEKALSGPGSKRSTLFLDESDSGGHSLLKTALRNNRTQMQSVDVDTTTLDEWFPTSGLTRLDVIKLDVQDLEEAFIRGGLFTLRKFKPIIIVGLELASFVEPGGLLALLTDSFELSARIPRGPTSMGPDEIKAHALQTLHSGKLHANYVLMLRPHKA